MVRGSGMSTVSGANQAFSPVRGSFALSSCAIRQPANKGHDIREIEYLLAVYCVLGSSHAILLLGRGTQPSFGRMKTAPRRQTQEIESDHWKDHRRHSLLTHQKQPGTLKSCSTKLQVPSDPGDSVCDVMTCQRNATSPRPLCHTVRCYEGSSHVFYTARNKTRLEQRGVPGRREPALPWGFCRISHQE